MKKRYYNVGTLLYNRSFKCGLETAAIIGIGTAVAATATGVASSVSQKNAQEDANETNKQLQREAMQQQEDLFREGNRFNHGEAVAARQFNANEARINRQFQEDLLRENREWYENYNSPSAQRARYLDAGLNPTTLAGNLGSSPSFSVPSGSAASSSPASAASAPSVPQAHVDPAPLNIGNTVQSALNSVGSLYDTFGKKEDVKSKLTFNEYYEQQLQSGLNLTRNEARLRWKEGNMIDEQTDLFRANRDKILEEIGLVQKQGKLYDKQGNLLDEQVIAQQIDNLWKNEDWQMSLHLKASQLHISQTHERWLSSLLKAQIAEHLGLAANAQAQAELAKATEALRGEEKVSANKYGLYLDSQTGLNNLELGIFNDPEMKKARKDYEKNKWNLDINQKEFENSFMMRSARWLNQVSTPLTIVLSAWMLKHGSKPSAPTKFQGPTIQTNTPYNPYNPLR